MDYFNKKKQIHFEDFDPSDFCHLTEEVEQESQILADLRLSQLENFMKELKQGDKLILLMRYQDSMSMKEISQTLKISEGAVKMRLRRSVYRLAELLKKAHDNE